MEVTRKDLRLLLLHEYRLGHKATVAARNICSTMGKDVLSTRVAQLGFKRFKEGKYDLEDQPHSGRPVEVDINALKDLIEADSKLTTRILAAQLGCSPTTIDGHLAELGKTWKYGEWVPHELGPHQFQARVDACMALLTFKRTHQWLRYLITADEKWVLYANYTRKRQWLGPGEAGVPTPRPDLFPKKIMVSVWWGINGVIHWELVPTGKTVDADLYCDQLDRVAAKLQGKQKKVYFLHDNAKAHIARKTRAKLLELGWTLVPHPPYSPDLGPSDYHLFRSLAHHLQGRKFDNEDALKLDLETFFNQKSPEFYERGILSLPERWRRVIDSDGAYIT